MLMNISDDQSGLLPYVYFSYIHALLSPLPRPPPQPLPKSGAEALVTLRVTKGFLYQ